MFFLAEKNDHYYIIWEIRKYTGAVYLQRKHIHAYYIHTAKLVYLDERVPCSMHAVNGRPPSLFLKSVQNTMMGLSPVAFSL